MKIRKLIGADDRVVGLSPARTVLEATERMVECHTGSVLVLDDSGRLLGIFTERDLMVRVVSKGLDPGTTHLEEVMTGNLYTTTPDRGVAEVRREMRKKHIRHVPVLEGDRVLAVLSMRNLVRADFERHRDDARALTEYIRGPMADPGPPRV